MTEQEQERLSALVDDELPRLEISAEIKRLSSQDARHATWGRYHLIGDVLRREVGPLVDPQMAARLHERIADEPVVLAPGALKRPAHWLKPAAGVAIAASVAAMAVVIAPQLINPEQGAAPTARVASHQPKTEHVYVAETGTRWEMLQKPKVESRFNRDLVNHQEFAPDGNRKGIMPYATFVSYDGQE